MSATPEKVVGCGILILILGGIFLLLFLIVPPIAEWWKNEITIFSTTMENGKLVALPPTIFRVYPETQTVLQRTITARRYNHCEVWDRENWAVFFDDEPGYSLLMVDGTYSTWGEGKQTNTEVKQVSRFYWWRVNWGIETGK